MSAAQYYHGHDEPFDHTTIQDAHVRNDPLADLLPGEKTNLLPHEGSQEPSFPVAQYDPTNVGATGDAYGHHQLDPSEDTLNDPQRLNDPEKAKYEGFEFAEPYDAQRAQPMAKEPSPMARFLGLSDYSLAQRIENKRRGIGKQRYPVVVWVLSVAMVSVFIYELVLNARNQGNPFSFKPVVNPMLGPSQSALINAGARYPPCMKDVVDLPPSTMFPCLNDTANPPDRLCPLEDVCGFGGFHNEAPDQWWRFITPIFLHAGIVHILLNLLAQLTASAELERDMGSIGFVIVYFAAGIFGNVLGGNFSLVGTPSIGASGAIFGTIAVGWVDLFAHWRYHYRPGRKLAIMSIELIIGFAIGFIPYVDNFAHIGGFLMGLLTGMVVYPIISPSRRHRIIVWGLKLAAIPLAVLLFVVLIRNFYTSDPYAACSWCRYLSCIPSSINNHCKGTGYSTTSSSTSL